MAQSDLKPVDMAWGASRKDGGPRCFTQFARVPNVGVASDQFDSDPLNGMARCGLKSLGVRGCRSKRFDIRFQSYTLPPGM